MSLSNLLIFMAGYFDVVLRWGEEGKNGSGNIGCASFLMSTTKLHISSVADLHVG